jgi:hypothetical protein
MEVKIYREPENQELILDEAKLAEYNQLMEELGIAAPTEEKKTPNVYQYLNSAMVKQLHALCPMYISVEKYTKSTIPVEVLKVLQYCKSQQMFDGYQIWWDDKAPDPLLIGWKWQCEDDKDKKYSWRSDKYLIARWGDCSMEIPELLEKGFERIKQELIDKSTLGLEQCNSMINNPDTYVRKILNDDSVRIDMELSAYSQIYNL